MTEMFEVRLLQVPLAVYHQAAEHSDELLREFALLGYEGGDHLPARLLALVDEVRARFGPLSAGAAGALQAALDGGETEVDITYRLPFEARQAACDLSDLLDEADEFCRTGDLLTLATPPEALAFRRWFLDEFVRQIDGAPPRPWPEAVAAAPDG